MKNRDRQGRRFSRGFKLGTEGGSMLEYIMLVGVLALAAIYGFRQARARENRVIAQQARIIRTLDPTNSSDPEWTDPEWGDDWTKPTCNAQGYCTNGQCFAAGTLVATETGLVPIETIREGDLLLSRDEKSGDVALRPVVKRFVTVGQAVIDLNIAARDGGETIRATNGHPFWVTGQGWVPAADIASNVQLWSPSGEPLHVATPATQTAVRYETVYNFEIADYHTYFVGHHGMWVHNGGPGTDGPIPPCQVPPPPKHGRCSDEQWARLYPPMKQSCSKPRSCKAQADSCASLANKIAAGNGCTDGRTKVQQGCYSPGDVDYEEHMAERALAFELLRECQRLEKEKKCF